MKTLVFSILFLLLLLPLRSAIPQQGPPPNQKATVYHKSWICAEICKSVDLLLYDIPQGHGNTTSCSYTDDRLFIAPKKQLNHDRMTRFTFLAFAAAGLYSNNDFMMPPEIYVGFGNDCQVLDIKAVALLQYTAKYDGDRGLLSAIAMAAGAPKISCPK